MSDELLEQPDSEIEDKEVEEVVEESPDSDVLPEERETEEEASPSEIDDSDGDDAGEVEANDEPDYEPNFTYRVKDDEFEMPDRIKELIKNPEDEEYFRGLLTAADGVSALVEDRQVLREDNTRLMQVESTRQKAVEDLISFVKQDDLKPFMDTWNITDEQLARYMQKRLALHDMDPAQRAEYERNEQARMQAFAMQNQNQTLQSQNQQLQAQQLEFQMNQALTSPEISDFVQNYDSQKGAGAFRNEVVALGDYYFRSGRGVVPPEQLAREVANKWYGPAAQPAPRQGAETDRGESRRPRVVERQQKPTMRKVRSSGASPVKSSPKNFADLQKIREQKYGN